MLFMASARSPVFSINHEQYTGTVGLNWEDANKFSSGGSMTSMMMVPVMFGFSFNSQRQ